MGLAGFSWGIYSLRGRGTANPVARTTSNFIRAVPFALVVNAIAQPQFHVEARGMWLAVLSGALASGLGYVLWYAALGGLTATRAAIVQLSVPVLAACGGVLFLQEAITMRLVISTVMILGGIALAIVEREQRPLVAAVR
jgi:drug/metabolite transporter (DMT)-like permease